MFSITLLLNATLRSFTEDLRKGNSTNLKKGCVSVERLFTQDSLIHVCCLGAIVFPRIIISRVPFYSAEYSILDNKICDYPSYILSKLGQSALFLKI